MMTDVAYLTCTTNKGLYGYRRRVPKKLQFIFSGKTEIIRAFNTKNYDIALIELSNMNTWFYSCLKSHGKDNKKSGEIPREKLLAIEADLKNEGIHPDALPKLDVHSSAETLSRFARDINTASVFRQSFLEKKIPLAEYLAVLKPMESGDVWRLRTFQTKRNLLLGQLNKKYGDPELINRDILNQEVHCDDPDYVVPQLKWDEFDSEVIKYRIMCGESVHPAPTWESALNTYLYHNLKKQRSPEQALKHERSIVSVAHKFGTVLHQGMNTRLVDIEQNTVKNFAETMWRHTSTYNRNLRNLASIWRSWDANNSDLQVNFDPFRGLINQKIDNFKQNSNERRAFTPAEFQHFSTSILGEPNIEIKLLGMIMAYCGAPVGEVASLVRSDIKLSASTPHMIFRNHPNRVMGGGRIERAVPFIHSGKKLLIYPLLTHLKDYLKQNDFKPLELVFPSFGSGSNSTSSRSKMLSKHICNMRSDIDSRQLVPYSLQQTFKDRVQSAGGIPSELGEYLMGNKTVGSRKVFSKYGTSMPLQKLVDHMTSIIDVQEHGFFEK